MKSLLELAGWIAISFVAAAIGGVATANAGDFYLRLDRPSWAPPQSVFGPVWSALYVLIGVSAWLVWRERRSSRVTVALSLWAVQHLLNGLWSWLFFAWHRGAWAFAEVVLLWGFIIATVVTFWRVKPLAGLLLVPYLLWVAYAAALTYAVWQRNPAILG